MKTSQLLTIAGILAGSVVATASAAGADAVAPIGPNQIFHGLVNGMADNAVIKVVCPGPSLPGQTGHPVAGQTIAVAQGPNTSPNSGYTGSAATSIIAGFGTASTSNALVFNAYDAPLAIPTSILLPCSGTGTVQFTPNPNSDTAHAESLPVTFVNIAV